MLVEIPDFGDIMPMEEFIDSCGTLFIDDDGFANPIIGDKMDEDVWIYPSDILQNKHRQYEKIIWFNR